MATPPAVVDEVVSAVAAIDEQLGRLMAAFDPSAVPLADAMACWEAFKRIGHRAQAGMVLLTEQVGRSGEWRRGGYKTPAEHLAIKAGKSKAAAKREERIAKELHKLPATAAAARRGELSPGQLEAVVDGASANPAKEQHLLGVAGRSSLRRTQEEAARVRSAAEDRDATERRAQRERHYRSFTRPDGTYGAAIQAPTAAGAEIDQAIEVVTDQIFEEKRRAGVHEPREAYQFDALRRICRQHLEGRARAADEAQPCGTLPERYLIQVRVDIEALNRGRTEGDELCEIEGIGAVPVSRVRALFGDAIVKLLVTSGTEVRNIVPAGRRWTAKQRMAVTWQDHTCCVSDCDNPRVEIDHVQPWAQGGATTVENAAPRCANHHRLKTSGWADYIDPVTGALRMVPPDDSRHPEHPCSADREEVPP